MTKKIYQLHILLDDSNPKIWRRILVDSEVLLVDLHRIIQSTFGWTNSHLHVFEAGMESYAPKEFEVEETKDSRKVKLNKIMKTTNSVIKYEYDFGDSWNHTVLLEKILDWDDSLQIPSCIDGKNNCPPEDCGGIWSYEDLLITLADKKHPEHDDMLEWLGGEFDPKYCNTDEINKLLSQKDYGCIWL